LDRRHQQEEIDEAPGVNLDDRLRMVRASACSPIIQHRGESDTQGISLRGLGSSGASRTLCCGTGSGELAVWRMGVLARLAPEDWSESKFLAAHPPACSAIRRWAARWTLFSRPASVASDAVRGRGNESTASSERGISHVWKTSA